MRDANYMCDSVTRYSKFWWTIDEGYCLPFPLAYQRLNLDSVSANDQCAFAVKCALSNALDQDCTCDNPTGCSIFVNSSCRDPTILYPAQYPLLSSYYYMYYMKQRDWTKKTPDGVGIYGRIKCIGFQFISTVHYAWLIFKESPFYEYRTPESVACHLIEGYFSIRDRSAPHYDIYCWNNSKTFNNRSYQVTFFCMTRCISKYRLRDGFIDCIPTEEQFSINNSCPQIQRHRLLCSSSEPTCLLADALGNWGPSCYNLRDEISPKDGTILRGGIFCRQRNDPGCTYLRDYIRTSSQDDGNDHKIVNETSMVTNRSLLIIPFRSYCDSFFNGKAGMDELPEFCQQWVCSTDHYQCLSGQCILQSWVCDSKATTIE